MIIPVKCFTCGEVIADKYSYYLREVKKMKIELSIPIDEVIYFSETNTKKTPEGKVLDKLSMNKICCRRHFLSHIDIE
jgi:DNA-directed RNA polymerase subunit N (RpoN/RPB10)